MKKIINCIFGRWEPNFNKIYNEYENIGDKDKTLTIEEYLYMITPYLSNIINDHKTRDEWKIQLTTAINFISSETLMRLVLCALKVII